MDDSPRIISFVLQHSGDAERARTAWSTFQNCQHLFYYATAVPERKLWKFP